MRKSTIITASVMVLMVAASGCTVHRQQSPPLPVPGKSYLEGSGGTLPQALSGRWWEAFGDEKLNSLVGEAIGNNLDIKIALSRFRQLRSIARGSRALRYPALDAKGEGSKISQPGIFGNDQGTSYSLSLSAAYEVDLWGKVKSGAGASLFEARASLEDAKAVYISLVAQLVDLYYLALEQRAQIELTDRTIESFEDTLNRVTRRYVQGLVPALDVYQARQNLAFAKSSRPVFEANLSSAELGISLILGRFPEKGVAGTLAELPDTLQMFPYGIPSQLLEERPDVKAQYLRLQAGDEKIAEAVAARYPSLNLLGNYGRSSSAFSTGDLSGTFWNILAGITLPIIDGGKRKAEVERSQAAYQEMLDSYKKSVLTAVSEVEEALARNRTSEERIKMLEERVEAASGALRLSLERYMQGLSDYLPVLSAQTADFAAASQLLAERRQLISDRISLARSLGGKWMEGEIADRIAASKGKGDEQ